MMMIALPNWNVIFKNEASYRKWGRWQGFYLHRISLILFSFFDYITYNFASVTPLYFCLSLLILVPIVPKEQRC